MIEFHYSLIQKALTIHFHSSLNKKMEQILTPLLCETYIYQGAFQQVTPATSDGKEIEQQKTSSNTFCSAFIPSAHS